MLAGRNNLGLTLIELLLTLVVLAIVSAGVATTLRSADQARDAAVDLVEQSRRVQLLTEILRQDLAGAMPPTGTMAALFTGTDDGQEDTLSFVTNSTQLPGQNRLGDLVEVIYSLQDSRGASSGVGDSASNNGFDLVRQVNPNILATTETTVEGQILISGLKGMDFQYYDGADWSDEWDFTQRQNTMPALVMMTLYPLPPNEEQKEKLIQKLRRQKGGRVSAGDIDFESVPLRVVVPVPMGTKTSGLLDGLGLGGR